MANGYLIAADIDIGAVGDLGDGFGLDLIAVNSNTDPDAVSAALEGAANVGVVLSMAAAGEPAFVVFLQRMAPHLRSPQLILVEPDALLAIAAVAPGQTLRILCGERRMGLSYRELGDYRGERSQRGAVLPRGWRKVDGLEVE